MKTIKIFLKTSAYIVLILLLFLEVLFILEILFVHLTYILYHSDTKYKELEKKYGDVSKYTPDCNHIDIMMLAYYYMDKGEIKKCKEWMMKVDKWYLPLSKRVEI